MKKELGDTLSKKRMKMEEDAEKQDDVYAEQKFKEYNDDGSNKRRVKEKQKEQALKEKYEKEKQREAAKRFSNSSFLTPESARYLNELMQEAKKNPKKDVRVDKEMVYAGLQNEVRSTYKPERNEKNKQRYKGRKARSKTKRGNRAFR